MSCKFTSINTIYSIPRISLGITMPQNHGRNQSHTCISISNCAQVKDCITLPMEAITLNALSAVLDDLPKAVPPKLPAAQINK